MTYSVLVNGSAPSESNPVIANIEATDVSASICWIGIITEDDGCNRCETERTYCEIVYVGENTTTSARTFEDTLVWHGNTIWYRINQSSATTQEECTTETYCSGGTNVWIRPYVVTKEADGHNIKLYTEYSAITVTTCGETTAITNVEKITSNGYSLSDSVMQEFEAALRDKACSNTDRTISVPYKLSDIVPCLSGETDVSGTAVCYVAEEEHCCDNSGTSVCYEIGEITYSPTSVPFSGGDVYYSFDYKKKTTVNCVTNTKIGTYTSSRPWHISGRIDGEEGQCQRKQVTSSVTPSIDDFITCTIPSSSLTLSIWQGKNSSACTKSSCTESIGYCVDKNSITQYYYSNESGGTWVLIDNPPYKFPFYGGQLKVTWGYSAITIYDDCSSAVTSGNTWEDVKTIDPYNGNDYFLSGDTRYDIIITAIKRLIQDYTTNETVANIRTEIESGKTVYYFTLGDNIYKIDYDEGFVKNTAEDSDEKYEIFNDSCGESGITVTLDYEFKTPSKVCESGNTFQIQYYQYRPPCIQDCPSCISGGSITLECGYSAITEYNEITSSTTIIGYDTSESGQTDLVPVTSETQCHVKSYSASTVPGWLSITINDNNIVYSANTRNSGSTSACSVVFVLDDVGGKECTETVIVMQIGSGAEQDPSSGPDELECPCRNADGLYFGVYSLGTIPYKGGSPYDVGSFGYDECVSAFTLDIIEIEVDEGEELWFTNSGITSSTTEGETEGILYGNVGCNCDCDEDRDIVLGYTYTASDCSEESGTTIITQSHNTNCRCNKISAATEGVIDSAGGNGIVIGTYQVTDDCPPSSATVSSTTASFIRSVWLENPNTLSSGNIYADVDCNYCNSSDRSGDITIYYNLSPTRSCTTSFTATQKAGVSATLTPSSNISFTGGNAVTLATFDISGEYDGVSGSVSDTSFITNVSADTANKVITGNVKCNYCNSTSRTNVVTLKYKKGTCECEKTCIITQNAGTSATLTPYDNIPSSGGNGVILATYQITGDNNPNITVSANTNFIDPIGVDTVNKTVTGEVKSNYCSGTSRDAIITMKYSNGGCECTKTCNVTQKAGTSAVLVPSGEIPCIGGEDIILATYLITGDESPSISVTVDKDFITNLTVSNGVVKGTVTENCCKTNERTCELTLKYGPDECEKECILTQKGGKGGKKIACCDETYTPYDDDTCPTINATSGGTLYLKLINDSNNT